ncbi:MAG TPA: RNA methyltransferase [Gemmatimonadaceae bacterium]|nr:RNA methyltransferase [Gemmatimonadaceae bacterium]
MPIRDQDGVTNERLLTLARDLRRRKTRERSTLFVVEGVRTAEELLNSTLSIRGALATAAFRATPRGHAVLDGLAKRGTQLAEVSESELESAADTEQPQGILAVAEIPSHSFESLAKAIGQTVRVLVLDAVQDPGNAGTLVRTGAALGASAVIALSGTADLWNAKAVRGAAGAHFRVPTLQCSPNDLVRFLREQRIPLWGAAADGTPIDAVVAPRRLALAVGNEGAGLSVAVLDAVERVIALPMAGGIESLNVAVAAGIALYALRP